MQGMGHIHVGNLHGGMDSKTTALKLIGQYDWVVAERCVRQVNCLM